MAQAKSGSQDKKQLWHKPAVQELGNLRDFVRAGGSFGKSINVMDGSSPAGNETMTMMFGD